MHSSNKLTLSVSLTHIVQMNKHWLTECFPNTHSSNKHWLSPQYTQFKQTLSVSPTHSSNKQTNTECLPSTHSSNKHWVSPQHTEFKQTMTDWQCPLLSVSVCSPQMEWLWVWDWECVCACVCTEWTSSMHYVGTSTYLFYQFILYYASAIHKHTHILKPFEDSEPMGLKVDYTADWLSASHTQFRQAHIKC